MPCFITPNHMSGWYDTKKKVCFQQWQEKMNDRLKIKIDFFELSIFFLRSRCMSKNRDMSNKPCFCSSLYCNVIDSLIGTPQMLRFNGVWSCELEVCFQMERSCVLCVLTDKVTAGRCEFHLNPLIMCCCWYQTHLNPLYCNCTGHH